MLQASFKGQDNEVRKQNMRAAIEALAEAVLSPGSGDAVFAEFLRLDRLLWRYSFGNTCLIALQHPNSRRVSSLARFDKLAKERGHKGVKWGREKYPQAVSLRAGAQAIWIWVPKTYTKTYTKDDGTTEKIKGVFFGPGPVWAVEDLKFRDTGGPCSEDPDFLPDFVPDHGPQVAGYHETLRLWAQGEGITVEQGDTGGAAGVSYGGRIVERIGDPCGKRFAVLVHEIGHELLHKEKEGAELPRRVKEAEAEAVANCVCHYFGLSHAEHSAAYLRNHGATKSDVVASMTRIYDTARSIVDAIESGTAEQEAAEAAEATG